MRYRARSAHSNLLFGVFLISLGGGPSSAAKLNPAAPSETAQFAFLVGEWRVEIPLKKKDGTSQRLHVDWNIQYILGGWSLQDNWRVFDGKGKTLNWGTMYRTYNKSRSEWTIVEQLTPRLEFVYMTAKKEGDTMVMYEHAGSFDGKITGRRVFYSIQANSFKWQHYSTEDGGKTWKPGATMHPKRRLNQE